MKLFEVLSMDDANVSIEAYVPNEDAVEEIANIQHEIVMDCEAMSEGVATIERLESMLVSHESLSDAVKKDVTYCNVTVENLNIVCGTIGLEPTVGISVEAIDGNDVAELSTEDIKATIQKIINAVKKMFLKVVAKIKQFITKLVHNGKRLDAKVAELQKIVESDKAEIIFNRDNVSSALVRKMKFFLTTLYALDDVNYKPSISPEVVGTIIDFSSTYKNISDYIELPKAIFEAKTKEDAMSLIQDYIKNFNTKKKLNTIYSKIMVDFAKNEFSDFSNIFTTPIRIDNGKISGIIIANKIGEDEFVAEYRAYSIPLDTYNKFKEKDLTGPDIDGTKDILKRIGKPSKVMEKLSKAGEEELSQAETMLKSLEKDNNENENSEETILAGKAISQVYNLIPKAINGNIINYYNNINNILDFIGTYIVEDKK